MIDSSHDISSEMPDEVAYSTAYRIHVLGPINTSDSLYEWTESKMHVGSSFKTAYLASRQPTVLSVPEEQPAQLNPLPSDHPHIWKLSPRYEESLAP